MRLEDKVTSSHYLVTYQVDQTGVRLDAFLKKRYRKRSREQLKKAIVSGAISIKRNQSPHLTVGKLKPSSQLIAGDLVEILSERKPEPEVSFDYKVLFEDEAIFVISKPPNLPVHPAGRYFFNTLLIHLKTRGHKTALNGDQQYFLAHRIDKETSGVLVLAKTSEVCAHLVAQFVERATQKRYLAIVRGIPPEEFQVDLPIMRSNKSRIELKMMTSTEAEGGQSALTTFKRLGVYGDFSLVECHPKTGRQHQIRVHLDSAGHPIVGDKLYGMPDDEALRFYERQHLTPEAEAKLLLPRHALHAAAIRFVHPLTGKLMTFEAELPKDMTDFLAAQSLQANRGLPWRDMAGARITGTSLNL